MKIYLKENEYCVHIISSNVPVKFDDDDYLFLTELFNMIFPNVIS